MMNDEDFMKAALEQARLSLPEDVPVGVVITKDNEIIASAFNNREQTQVATRHAEVEAIEEACKKLKTRRLHDCTIYVTLEPCIMCGGALIQSQIGKIIFGARDKQYGCAGGIYNFFSDPRLNHNCEVTGGVLENECSSLLDIFFKTKR